MKKVLHTVIVLGILAVIGFTLNKATVNRTSDGCIQLSDYYKLKKDTVDVLFVGSSHVYYSINPCQLYQDYGIAGYLMASPGQPVWIGYHLLEEALKTQKPKLIVYDVYTLYRTESEAGSWECLLGMKPSLNKWNAINAVNEEGPLMDKYGAFFSFPYYHTRYDELTRKDYDKEQRSRYLGYKPDYTVISKKKLAKWEQIDRTGFDQAKAVDPRTERYLRKLIELCRDEEIPLVLVNAPYANQMLEKQQAHNYTAQIAKEYGVPFIDGNRFVEQMRIDFSKDLVEVSHLNYYGSVKYTDYLGQWIKNNYVIEDRRGQDNYRHWEEVSNRFERTQLLKKELKKTKKYEDYKEKVLALEDCVAVFYEKPNGGVNVYEDGENIYTKPEESEYFEWFDLGTSSLAVSGGSGEVRVLLDRKEYTSADQGMNVLVYDKTAGKVIGRAGFEEY